MNVGGDPGHEDYGLPPVDIEVPDDARELDRDVQAYYRELRAQRRRRRARRLCAPLLRDGMVLPLLAGCLALTLLAGTLLTVFTAQPPASSLPPLNKASARQASLAPRASPQLPNITVLVGGHRRLLRRLPGTARLLALIPSRCPRCDPGLRQLTRQARQVHVMVYVVGTGGARMLRLSRRARLGRAHVVEDYLNKLPSEYHPTVLTAVLVASDGSVTKMIADPSQSPEFQKDLLALAAASPSGAP